MPIYFKSDQEEQDALFDSVRLGTTLPTAENRAQAAGIVDSEVPGAIQTGLRGALAQALPAADQAIAGLQTGVESALYSLGAYPQEISREALGGYSENLKAERERRQAGEVANPTADIAGRVLGGAAQAVVAPFKGVLDMTARSAVGAGLESSPEEELPNALIAGAAAGAFGLGGKAISSAFSARAAQRAAALAAGIRGPGKAMEEAGDVLLRGGYVAAGDTPAQIAAKLDIGRLAVGARLSKAYSNLDKRLLGGQELPPEVVGQQVWRTAVNAIKETDPAQVEAIAEKLLPIVQTLESTGKMSLAGLHKHSARLLALARRPGTNPLQARASEAAGHALDSVLDSFVAAAHKRGRQGISPALRRARVENRVIMQALEASRRKAAEGVARAETAQKQLVSRLAGGALGGLFSGGSLLGALAGAAIAPAVRSAATKAPATLAALLNAGAKTAPSVPSTATGAAQGGILGALRGL